MKKILLLSAVTLFTACNKIGNNEFLINGSVKGLENGRTVILEVQNETGTTPKDTVRVENGTFEVKGKFEGSEIAFLNIDGLNGGLVPFILEEGEINIAVDKDTIQKTKIGGTKNNDKFQEYNDNSAKLFKEMVAFQKANQQKFMDASKAGDQATIKALMDKNQGFQDKMDQYSQEFVKKNPESFLSVLLLENFATRQTIDLNKIETLFNQLTTDLKKTRSGKSVEKIISDYKSVEVGKDAPNFSAKTPEGKTVSLKESLGKVTIIDFWASWCTPCRAENPNVVALYNEFHEKGLNIIGVSLDKTLEPWKEAIAKDKITWTQVSNLKFWQEPIAKLYNVKQIPATFILDANGKIVGKDLRGDELRAKISELLAK